MEILYIFGMISLFGVAGIIWALYDGHKLDHMSEK